MNKLISIQSVSSLKSFRFIHTTCARFVDQDWRKDQRLAMNPNKEGPLTNLPDYTFMDGRPTPLGRQQMRRIMHQREITQKIIAGNWEIDFAVDRHARLQAEEEQAKRDILNNKLKPKGHLLLRK